MHVRDFPKIELDGEINSPLLLNELGDPRFFSLSRRVLAKNSLIKNIFEEGKKFDSYPLATNHGTVRKSARIQAIKNSLNEAILIMSINEALLSR